MLFAGNLLWFISSLVGLAYSQFTGNTRTLGAAVYFGAFVVAGFEAIILSGAFVGKLSFAFPLGAIHPSILILTLNYLGGIGYVIDGRTLGLGILTWALAPLLMLGFMRIRTRQGDRSIPLFQAFLKTWVIRNPVELEKTLERYTETVNVTTSVVKFELASKNLLLVLPGIHPGPFYPVGSYNLPGLLFEKAKTTNSIALTLHRPGGHERNLATQEASKQYVESIINFANKIPADDSPVSMRGPALTTMNHTIATSLALDDSLLLFLSSSPYGTDDIDLDVEETLSLLAQTQSFKLSVIDAHNSINQERVRIRVEEDGPWRQLFLNVKHEEKQGFRLGFAHSSEIGFKHGSDLSSAGLGVLVFAIGGLRSVLVISDSNNAIAGARKRTEDELDRAGFKLLEICTSDSHNLAARGLTINRGYFALGESTPMTEVTKAIVELARIASTRLASCHYGVADWTDALQVLGAESINEFALAARRSSRFAKRYSKVALPLIALLFILTVV